MSCGSDRSGERGAGVAASGVGRGRGASVAALVVLLGVGPAGCMLTDGVTDEEAACFAEVELLRGEHEQALERLEELEDEVEGHRAGESDRFVEAYLAHRREKWTKAVELWEELLAEFPDGRLAGPARNLRQEARDEKILRDVLCSDELRITRARLQQEGDRERREAIVDEYVARCEDEERELELRRLLETRERVERLRLEFDVPAVTDDAAATGESTVADEGAAAATDPDARTEPGGAGAPVGDGASP